MTASQPELALEGLPKRLFACTPTRLTTWLDCRRRYRFTYLDRPQPPKGPPWAHNSVGSAVHLAMAGWHRLDPAARTPEAAGRLLDQVWLHDGFRNDEQSELWRDRAREMVTRYASTLDPDDEPLGVERTVAHPHVGARRLRPGRPARPPGRRRARAGRGRRLQDRTTAADVVRREELARARPLRAGRDPHLAPAVRPGRAAPPAER